MTDIEILKIIERKLKIQIGEFKTWSDKRKEIQKQRKESTKDENVSNKKQEVILREHLDEKQLATTDRNGNVIELYLNGLNLKKIPEEIFDLKNLQRLDVVNNALTHIPEKLSELSKLNTLYFFTNQITEIPDEVLFMKSLKKLDIHNNPLNSIPLEVLESKRSNNLTAIRDYVNSLKHGTKSLNEIKVIIVGDGGSGKTSLQKLLTKEKFNPQESQTHGINIKNINLRPNNKNVKYRLWDFGGQEIMHATHQFFLSRRSIYLILLNAREEPNPEYWLNHIKSFGGNSPVIIVINKIDENPSYDVNRLFLQQKYPNIIKFIKISCSENKGIESVKGALRNAVLDIENLNVQWALSWFKVKTHLENMSTNYISYDEFNALCIEKGIFDLSSQNTLVEYLNDLGIILHFKDFSLSDTHVLDPEWVTFAVYKIINSKKLATNKGVLKLSEIRTILRTKENDGKFKYPSSQLNYIIELMMKFELCYRISNTEILVPDLLAVQEPIFKFEDDDILNIVVSYEFLPKSIMPRLIVNLHNDIIDELRWRTGIIIKDSNLNTTAKIKADYDRKEIQIGIYGDKKRDYLSIILFIIRKINRSFKGLETKVNIPIPNSKGVVVSHSHLLTLESKGITKYIPDGLDYEIDVRKYLGSVQGNQSTEDEIFAILEKIASKTDNQDTLMEKANEIVQLQPNFFGLGINLNALVKKFIRKK
ncbi:COR domain-containing protein [Winogradskyella psychrotolerans]|uniref:COR domain-containing protein n=1 Tax=Winogradskyella psychrotolerans TaxID=1344585 RepID=UPI001C07988F|nr:COR domain-containing protein [Winogradskyella psychrotolerans]MBU2928202.1 GTP-binding protein [Winogradskyella psychrotolerans]